MLMKPFKIDGGMYKADGLQRLVWWGGCRSEQTKRVWDCFSGKSGEILRGNDRNELFRRDDK